MTSGSPATPNPVTRARFRLTPLRSPLLGGSIFLSFPPGTKMFQFPGCPPDTYFIQCPVTRVHPRRVAPFGYPRLKACLRLPVAFRSLPRPSSAPAAKASTTHTCSLDLSRASFYSLSCYVKFSKNTQRPPLPWSLKTKQWEQPAPLSGVVRTTDLEYRLLLRKEVIQPHLPIRLPCYDFTPITSPTFDGCLPLRGWPTGFGCCRLSWCDGRCVQGPGTYSPQYADLRLLAIPTSCRRVAACNPNWDRLFGFRSGSPLRLPLYRPL